ncbi:MAG: hypothetical protein ACT4PO_06635 [Actinomycetota bacterium]
MARYKVAWDYRSSYGAFDEGSVVEVDDELAEAINRDSPGVLRAVKAAAKDRMLKGSTRDRHQDQGVGGPDREGGPSDQGAMTRADAAVKDKG